MVFSLRLGVQGRMAIALSTEQVCTLLNLQFASTYQRDQICALRDPQDSVKMQFKLKLLEKR